VYEKHLKRPLDFIFALLGLIILSPLLLAIAILVRVKLGSPVIFTQQRPGLDEKTFTLYKFRTMTDERDDNGDLLLDEKRFTSFGKFLRSTSLDELPELWNILGGDMSFVGPRPLSVKYLPYYTSDERRRHEVRPGLTGLAQINGRNAATWEQRFKHDIFYVENVSLSLDVRILANTAVKVVQRSDIANAGEGRPENFHEYRAKQLERATDDREIAGGSWPDFLPERHS